jgi:hypothetical protein
VIETFSFSESWPLSYLTGAFFKEPHVRGLLTRLQPHAEAMQETKFAISSKINQHIVFVNGK